ncbi:MAG: hypothetical protein R3D63_08225 [Paracoccaceae bacterium]
MTRLDARLAALAAAGETLTYGALARELGLRMADLTAALEATMEADTAAGAPLRAALCEARLTPGLPAPGFFAKAAALGHAIGDPAGFVADHRARLSRA